MNPPVRAPLGSALALLMTLAALAGAPGPGIGAALVVVLVLMIAAGWPELLELPSAGGTRAVVATTGKSVTVQRSRDGALATLGQLGEGRP